jgi:hypothetical protein
MERSHVVGLAQLVERQIVVLEVVGSNPTSHPTLTREAVCTMTIDERLEKLTERHEALTQTVELIAAMQRDLTRDVQGLRSAAQQDGENIRASSVSPRFTSGD